MSKIGVIDSGVGGLTILFDVYEKYPNHEYYYLGDSKHCPYGEKTEGQIKNFSYNLVKYLVDNFNIEILVIACNSISSVATHYLKDNFKNIKIIEVIKPTANYIKGKSKNNKIGIIATKATIVSGAYQSLLQKYEVYSKATPTFVSIVENGIITQKEEIHIHEELKEILDKNIDTLILGCTHFPLLKDKIQKIFGGNIITSSEGVIKELSFLNNIDSKNSGIELYTTGSSLKFDNQINSMFKKNYKSKTVDFNEGYYLELNNFEGPIDLLLHLVKENDVDIYDINVSFITNKYIEYIKLMKNLDITIASEYLVMASYLIELKSKSLLPNKEEEIIDEYMVERNELISKLIEYEKYKKITNEFVNLKSSRDEIHTKLPSDFSEYLDANVSTIDNLDINMLVEAMNKFIDRKKEEKPINTKITTKEYSVTEKCNKIREMLKNNDKISFRDLFDNYSKTHVVTTFLSLLELVKSSEISITQDNNFNDIIISRKSDSDE